VKSFEVPVYDFDRARLFYVEALGLQSWDAEYPIPGRDQIMRHHAITGWKKPKGYFVRILDEEEEAEKAVLILIGMRKIVGYERVVYVLDIEEAKKKILAAGGQVFE
jgi:predicted enzyme related to lactoylglutathione lyase